MDAFTMPLEPMPSVAEHYPWHDGIAVIFGQASTGKTAFALQVAADFVAQGNTAFVLSDERPEHLRGIALAMWPDAFNTGHLFIEHPTKVYGGVYGVLSTTRMNTIVLDTDELQLRGRQGVGVIQNLSRFAQKNGQRIIVTIQSRRTPPLQENSMACIPRALAFSAHVAFETKDYFAHLHKHRTQPELAKPIPIAWTVRA